MVRNEHFVSVLFCACQAENSLKRIGQKSCNCSQFSTHHAMNHEELALMWDMNSEQLMLT